MALFQLLSKSGIVALTTVSVLQAQAQLARPPQYILISFDGSYNAEMWKATREHAVATQSKVTHFISGVDFLMGSSTRRIQGATDHIYIPPRYKGGRRSDIGFGGDRNELIARVVQMRKSIAAGMEIGGHANAHFDGTKWTAGEWSYELNLFNEYVTNVFRINSLTANDTGFPAENWKSSLVSHLRSIRAPYLGRGPGLWSTLGQPEWTIDGRKAPRFLYDASDVAQDPTSWPEKSPHGFWYLRMAVIPVPGMSRGVLSMDYNMYVAHSDNPAAPKDKPEKVQQFENQVYQAYLNWFMRNYYGNRAPINIGHHFSTWNKGAYWRALKRLMMDVCQQPEVKCVTGAEVVTQFLQKTPAENLKAYERGEFNKTGVPRLQIAALNKTLISESSDEQNYRRVKEGYAYLPQNKNFKYLWRWKKTQQTDKPIDLFALAQAGVSKVELSAIDRRGVESSLPLMIDWNPLQQTVSLKYWSEEKIQACTSEAHSEKVDTNLLKNENLIEL